MMKLWGKARAFLNVLTLLVKNVLWSAQGCIYECTHTLLKLARYPGTSRGIQVVYAFAHFSSQRRQQRQSPNVSELFFPPTGEQHYLSFHYYPLLSYHPWGLLSGHQRRVSVFEAYQTQKSDLLLQSHCSAKSCRFPKRGMFYGDALSATAAM